jgi:hypothetical protein
MLDELNPVGAAGTVVTEMAADCVEAPAVVLVVIAVREYVVFEVAPVKSAGEVLLVVVGPEGDTVNAVDIVPAPVPPVHPIRNPVAVTAGEVCRDKTGVVGRLPPRCRSVVRPLGCCRRVYPILFIGYLFGIALAASPCTSNRSFGTPTNKTVSVC